jgi:hypothetical protein
LDEGIDLGFDYDEIMAEPEIAEPPCESSNLEALAAAAMSNIDTPGLTAQITGALAPSGAGEVVTQAAQMAIGAALPAAQGFMEAAHNQHAFPAPPLEGVDFIRNENGEPEPIQPMVHTVNDNGESVWVRPSSDKPGGRNDR